MHRQRRRLGPPRLRGPRLVGQHLAGQGSSSLPRRHIRPGTVGQVGCMVAPAGMGSDLVAEMHTVAGRVRCTHSLEEAAGSRKSLSGVQRGPVATDEGMARSLAVHTGYMMAEVRLVTHMVPAAGARMERVAADKGRRAHTGMDCAGRLVGHTGCTGSA